MVILNKELEPLVVPPKGWGVVKRQHKWSDFVGTLKAFAFMVLFGVPLLIPTIRNITFQPNAETEPTPLFAFLMIGFVISTIVTLCVINSNWNEPRLIALNECEDKAKAWECNVLQPYLEAKYGLKFPADTRLFSYAFYSYAYYDNRSMQVRVNGIGRRIDSTFAVSDMSYSHYYKQTEPEIWLEEVIQPQQVSYRALAPKM